MAIDAFDVDEEEFEDLPSTDIEVDHHLHFGMAGTFPLRLADVFFADDGLHIVEYGYITLMFGLGARKHRREANAMQAVYETHGIDEVMLRGDSVYWLNYDGIARVLLHRGGWVGRAKLTVYVKDGESYAYRIHEHGEEEEMRELVEGIEDAADRYGFPFEVRDGVGFRPVENLQRFFG